MMSETELSNIGSLPKLVLTRRRASLPLLSGPTPSPPRRLLWWWNLLVAVMGIGAPLPAASCLESVGVVVQRKNQCRNQRFCFIKSVCG
jgi:hypothetical protein